ncbi:efflux RND transporter periplasmic adaptor subunit [Shewanella surugensis]|uniref:Efflux RND transporter periplasmic adaptor subunit n=1 Tax=Shewanella surugensis TaxID=212020 RepID=A0ABT0LGR9_9GAMM|nr:efflux RND transporter periplasmic adaptor subunit [Shewanella surugensis]MCL1126565.1 efflux RND transporter periplasmic adaptor subunit [Shewanella surugensis]
MKPKKITLITTLIASLCIIAAITYTRAQKADYIKQSRAVGQPTVIASPEVEVITVNKQDYQAEIIGHGEAKSRNMLVLTTEVSGQVETLSPQFETGKQIKQGALLASLNDTNYQQAVTDAQVSVADAKVALLEEERQGQQAQMEWKNSGMKGEPDSSLVLRQPQLIAAQAALSNAQRQLKTAQRNLQKTQITAPFNALIISRDIQPGSYLSVGTTVSTLYSTDRVEITIPLSEHQWNSLPTFNNIEPKSWLVTLTNTDATEHWQGYVQRIEQHLDSSSRQRALIVAIDSPLEQTPALFPGTFLTARVQGATLNAIWALPASAISQSGDVWYLDNNSNLMNFKANKLFEIEDKVYITPVDDKESAQIVIRPLNNYLVGMKMTPTQSDNPSLLASTAQEKQ